MAKGPKVTRKSTTPRPPHPQMDRLAWNTQAQTRENLGLIIGDNLKRSQAAHFHTRWDWHLYYSVDTDSSKYKVTQRGSFLHGENRLITCSKVPPETRRSPKLNETVLCPLSTFPKKSDSNLFLIVPSILLRVKQTNNAGLAEAKTTMPNHYKHMYSQSKTSPRWTVMYSSLLCVTDKACVLHVCVLMCRILRLSCYCHCRKLQETLAPCL